MNVIMVLIDSMNRRYLGAYGCKEGITPNIDRFAEKAVVFDCHFISSAPCMPARRELMTGRQEFLWRGWGPLEPFDRPIASEARKAGATTAIVTDHYHYWENSAHGYIEHFDGAELIRGHECDYYKTDGGGNGSGGGNGGDETDGGEGAGLPGWAQAIADRGRKGFAERYYRNVKDFKKEEDFFSPKTFSAACDWLDANHGNDKFFLWVESFDAHEPFHVPEPYKSMYTDSDGAGFTCWPPYQDGYHGHNEKFWETTTPEEIAYIQSQYKGKLTMVDAWLGKLLKKLDELDLWDDTAVIITTDHGHELGEKGRFGKQPPMYDLSAHIPLMVWHPAYPGGVRADALTTAPDLYPTILEMLGAHGVESPHGRSLMQYIKNAGDKNAEPGAAQSADLSSAAQRAEPGAAQSAEAAGIHGSSHRNAVMYGTYGSGVTITDKDYTYHCTWDADKPLNWYSATYAAPKPGITGGEYIPGVAAPVWRVPWASDKPVPELLFDRREDPAQEHNIAAERPDVVAEMRKKLVALMRENGAPEEQFERLMLLDNTLNA